MLERLFGSVMRRTMLTMAEGEKAAELDCPGEAPEEERTRLTTDLKRGGEHEPITWDLIQLVEHSPELRRLLERSIQSAAERVPDRRYQPVHSLASYYAFIDWSARALPWAISPAEEYSLLYDRIDQSMGCFYFVCDQPLEELEGRGYYHASLMYHEPYRSWLVKFTSAYGAFLNTEESWCEDFYRNALEDPSFGLDGDQYEDPENWRTFNDFFSRRLRDPGKRPVEAPEDESLVVSPADAVPQGLWRIDAHNRVTGGPEPDCPVAIKTGTLTDVSALLGDSPYAGAFAGGTLTHTMLDVNDYHRYHFPVSGTVREVSLIPGDDATGGVIVWDEAAERYKEYGSEQLGWQSIETRGAVVLETEGGALVAVVPVGMCEVASVNFEETVKPGARVKKGDPLGWFLFGGSDIILLFSREAGFTMTAEAGKHLNTGRAYGYLGRENN